MECQNTIKNLRINKEKVIGQVVVVVEGEEDEFKLLKHIFTKILGYSYIQMKRNKVMQHTFKNNQNTVIVANTKSSSISSIMEDKDYKDKLYNLLKKEYNKTLKNTFIYILWDRDKDTNKDSNYIKALETYANSMDNDYEMNGLLLISYPCLEAYNLSNFDKKLWKRDFKTSFDAKKTFHMSLNSIKDINEKTILLAVYNMHHSMLEYGINNYDPSNFKRINKRIFRLENEYFKHNKMFNALSLISIMLVDLGIIEEI